MMILTAWTHLRTGARTRPGLRQDNNRVISWLYRQISLQPSLLKTGYADTSRVFLVCLGSVMDPSRTHGDLTTVLDCHGFLCRRPGLLKKTFPPIFLEGGVGGYTQVRLHRFYKCGFPANNKFHPWLRRLLLIQLPVIKIWPVLLVEAFCAQNRIIRQIFFLGFLATVCMHLYFFVEWKIVQRDRQSCEIRALKDFEKRFETRSSLVEVKS